MPSYQTELQPYGQQPEMRIKRIVFPLLLLFWLFCLPLAFSIYTPYLYQTNCYWNERCERMGEEKTAQSINELTGFFLHHSNELKRPWTIKENLHMREVRAIYDRVFIIFALITLIFIIDLWFIPHAARRYSRYAANSLLISTCLAILAIALIPFFSSFWMHIFHPLLFDNELWRTNPRDISWYLMPKAFFLRVIIFICVSTLLLNILLWWFGRPRKT